MIGARSVLGGAVPNFMAAGVGGGLGSVCLTVRIGAFVFGAAVATLSGQFLEAQQTVFLAPSP